MDSCSCFRMSTTGSREAELNGEAMPKRKEKNEKEILYVKLASAVDLARYAYNFDFTSRSLLQFKAESGVTRVVCLGEAIGNVTLGYYVNIDSPSAVAIYNFPSSRDERESVRFAGNAEGNEKKGIGMINLDLSVFGKAKGVGKGEIMLIKVGSPEDLVHATIKRTVNEEAFMNLYAFDYKGKSILCCFDLIQELADDRKTFYYAVLKDKKRAGFAKYSYANNTFEFTETVEEHSYIYVKIINLAEPFQFFKMPE